MQKIKKRLYDIVFEADTPAGKAFDVIILVFILLSVFLVMLESVKSINQQYSRLLKISEWIITIIFTIEYILRILIVKRPAKYIFSTYGVIDFLSVIPTYLSLFLLGAHNLLIIRALRLLRVFRILKLTRYSSAGQMLAKAIWSSRGKIGVFVFFVLTIVVLVGTFMYLIEGEEHGFSSIPVAIYWAIVTLTTVGYGDISPGTAVGQFLASAIMIIGYAIIAVPTGIITAEIVTPNKRNNTQVCPHCLYDKHDDDARHCKKCGTILNPHDEDIII